MLGERLIVVVVPHLIRVAVVCRDADLAADLADGIDEPSDAGIDRLDRLDDGRDDARMPDHVAVGIVEDDEVILAGLDRLDDLVRDLDRAHLRLQIIGRHLWRMHENAVLTLVRLLDTAVEEECDVCVLLRLRDAQLGVAEILHILAKGIVDLLGRERHECVHPCLVLRERRKGDLQRLVACEAVKLRIDKGVRELTRTVGTEVVENRAVAVLHALIALDHERHDELIRHALGLLARIRVRCKQPCHSGLRHGLCLRVGNRLIGELLALPALIAIHGVVTPADRSDLADADLRRLFLDRLEILLRALGRHIAPIEEGMNPDLGQTLTLRELEHGKEMIVVTVHAARGDQAHNVQRAAVLLDTVHDGEQCLILKKVSVLDITRDARELLIDDTPCADVRMSDLGVAHLPVRQTDVLPRCLDFRMLELLHQAVEYRRLCHGDGIVLQIVRIAISESIHDDERNRRVLKFCHNIGIFLRAFAQNSYGASFPLSGKSTPYKMRIR